MVQDKLTMELQLDGSQPSVVVEAGHIYTNENPSQEHVLGATIGAQWSALLQHIGYAVEKVLFIDDYNPAFEDKPIVLNEVNYQTILTGVSFSPDSVWREVNLVNDALGLMEKLLSEGKAFHHPKTGKVMLHKKDVLLYDPSLEHFKCSLLDAALYIKKLEKADFAVTVLPKSYKAQQKGTKYILSSLGHDTSSIIPLYFATPSEGSHDSVMVEQVFSDSVVSSKGGTLQGLIKLLQQLEKMPGERIVGTSLDLEVMQYVV